MGENRLEGGMLTTAKVLILGPSKAGKSWLGATTPPPRLIIDLEGRAKYTPAGEKAVYWDGKSDPLSLSKSPTRTYILETIDLDVLDMGNQWLRSGKHPFVSVTLDSAMEYRDLTLFKLFPGPSKMERNQYGDVNKAVENFLKDLWNLPSTPGNKVQYVVFITGVTMDENTGRTKPLGLGGLSQKLPHKMDLVGYLENKGGRRLWLTQRAEGDLEVGDGTNSVVNKLGSPIKDPDLETIFAAMERSKE